MDTAWASRPLLRLLGMREHPEQALVAYVEGAGGEVRLAALLTPSAALALGEAPGAAVGVAAPHGGAPAVPALVLSPAGAGAEPVVVPLPVHDPELRMLTRRMAGQDALEVALSADATRVRGCVATIGAAGRDALLAALGDAPGGAAAGAAIAQEAARSGRTAVLAEEPDGRVCVLAALPRTTLEGLRGGVALHVGGAGGRPSVRIVLDVVPDESLWLPIDLADPGLGPAGLALAGQGRFRLVLTDPSDPEAVLEQEVALPGPAVTAIARGHRVA